MEDLRIVIVDDHPLTRDGIKLLLDAPCWRMTVVGEASTGMEMVELARECVYDVAILDLMLPDRNGIDLIRLLKNSYPQRKILVLTGNNDAALRQAALAHGADAFLSKRTAPRKIVESLKHLFHTEGVSTALADRSAEAAWVQTKDGLLADLPARELQVMHYLIRGSSNREIAQHLFISPKTVSTYKTRLLRRFNLSSTAELVRFAIANDIDQTSS
jgi:DNA-binding NarL/FixJ family response regulator